MELICCRQGLGRKEKADCPCPTAVAALRSLLCGPAFAHVVPPGTARHTIWLLSWSRAVMQDMQGSCAREAMMDKLHAVMHLLGWERLGERVGLADRVTLAAARRYRDFRQGHAWRDMQANLEAAGGQHPPCLICRTPLRDWSCCWLRQSCVPVCLVEAVLQHVFWALKLDACSGSAAPFGVCRRTPPQSAHHHPCGLCVMSLPLSCPAGLQPTREDQQLIEGGIQAARSAAEATVAEQQSLLHRLAEELQAQDIEHVRQAGCSARWSPSTYTFPPSAACPYSRLAALHIAPLAAPCCTFSLCMAPGWRCLPHAGCADGVQGQPPACIGLASLVAEEVALVLACRGKQLQAQQEAEARKYKKDRSTLTVKVGPIFERCTVPGCHT